ncbi:MAG: NAD-dependent DNA ligase LigA [Schleiferiaceae bacterium]
MSLDRLYALREELHAHNRRYYIEDNPSISDQAFDALLRELQDLEAQHPEAYDPNSPSQRVGGTIVKSFEAVAHKRPMLSLSNSYSAEELAEFVERAEAGAGESVTWSAELKYDGVAISLWYENRQLVRALTRGDGEKGDDVSVNIRTISSLPLTLPADAPDELEVRGEVVYTFEKFEALNARRQAAGQDTFANPRNAASGTLKMQDSAEVARRGLSAFMYAVYSEDRQFASHREALDAIHAWGFPTPSREQRWVESCSDVAGIQAFLQHWDVERQHLPFAIDGAVVKIESTAVQQRLGSTAKSPRWAMAYKFNAEKALTPLLDVIYQVGRTGAITPVAVLEPVWLSGTVVKRASIHNADQIAKLDLHLGDFVSVEKGGEIIPKITEVDLSKRPAKAPVVQFLTHCPDCGTALQRRDGEAQHFCPNAYGCAPQVKGRIEHFVHRKAMDVEGIGTETVDQLVDAGLVQRPADLYDLTWDQWAQLDKFKDKSIQNALDGLQRSKDIPFERVLFAMGIRHVGETVAKKLAKHFGSLESLSTATQEALENVGDIGPMIAASVLEYFSDLANLHEVERLRAHGLQMTYQAAEGASDVLGGQTFVISGVFTHFTRDGIKAAVEQNGGRIASSVSSKTQYLLAGEGVGPSKRAKAEQLGVKWLTEEDFRSWIGSTD